MDIKKCRICGGIKHLKNIVGEEMINKLLVCVNININIEDLLPKLICEQCEKNLDFCYDMRKQSESTQKSLMLEVQRKQNDHRSSNEQKIEESTVETISEDYNCEKVDLLSQCSRDSSESLKMVPSISNETISVKVIQNEKHIHALDSNETFHLSQCSDNSFESVKIKGDGFEENNSLSCTPNEFFTNETGDSCETLNVLTKVPIASEYCSIDLLSSESSTNDGCDLKNKEDQHISKVSEALSCVTSYQEEFNKYKESRINSKDIEIETYQCIHCCKLFPSRYRLKRHEESHNDKDHGIKSYQCIHCCKIFPSRYRLKRHEETHNDISSHQCSYCSQSFKTLYNLKQHIKSARHEESHNDKDHGIKTYQCIHCCKIFPSRCRLKRHEETHNDISSHQCSYCSQSFKTLYNLKRHIKSAHLEKESWECNICNKNFSRVFALQRHLQLHSDDNKFGCSLCSKSFKTKDYLNAHHKKHSIENSELPKIKKRTKKYNGSRNQCGHCGKLFKSLFAYKNHLLIHTDEKPYKCETCGKNFRTIAAVTVHQRIHDDYRPYQCDLCFKSFRQTAHLKEHRILHHEDSVPQHVCPICEATFAKKGNLKAHMHTHTKEKAFKCADCPAEFNFIHLLQRHASKAHCRSADQVYTLNDFNDINKSNHHDVLQTEIYHYIDIVADVNNDEFVENDTNVVDLVTNDQDIIGTTTTELKITESDNQQTIIYNEHITDQMNDNENLIKDQKVDILVAEETKLTKSIYNAYRIE